MSNRNVTPLTLSAGSQSQINIVATVIADVNRIPAVIDRIFAR